MNGISPSGGGYESPRILEIGGLVELTGQASGGGSKPCQTDDGQAGTVGNCGGNGGRGIGS